MKYVTQILYTHVRNVCINILLFYDLFLFPLCNGKCVPKGHK